MTSYPAYNAIKQRWTPKQLSGLVGFYDATRGITLVGSSVDIWADQSGRGNNMSAASAGVRPTYEVNGLGTGPCVTFDGISQYLRKTGFSFGASVSAWTVAVVGYGVTFTSTDILWSYNNNPYVREVVSAPNNVWQIIQTGNVAGNVDISNASVWQFDWDGSNIRVGRNGLILNTAADAGAAKGDNSTFSIGAANAGGTPSNIKVAAIVVVNRKLTDAEYLQIYDYSVRTGWLR